MSITLRKQLHVAAQQAGFHLAMANMHVMYDTQRACSPSLKTRNVDHFQNSQSHRHVVCVHDPGREMGKGNWWPWDDLITVFYAPLPMTVTDSGIAMLAKELQPSKAAVRIAVTDGWWRLPKTCTLQSRKVPNGLHWLRDCDLYRIRDIVMLLKDLQPQKTRIPMSVTDSGIVMPSKEMQSWKAPVAD